MAKPKSEPNAGHKPAGDRVENGLKVTLEYMGTLDDGTVFDTSHGKAPLQYVAGAGQLLPAFEEHVTGMKKDEEKSFTLSAQDGYGERDEALARTFPRAQFPPNVELKEGAILVIKTADGQPALARIAKLGKDSVTLDFNHPLAGKSLHFKVKVVAVEQA